MPNEIDELKRFAIAVEATLAADKPGGGLIAKTWTLVRRKRMAFGASSERIAREISQLELNLDEFESTAAGAGTSNGQGGGHTLIRNRPRRTNACSVPRGQRSSS